jgi:hypothetical protein
VRGGSAVQVFAPPTHSLVVLAIISTWWYRGIVAWWPSARKKGLMWLFCCTQPLARPSITAWCWLRYFRHPIRERPFETPTAIIVRTEIHYRETGCTLPQPRSDGWSRLYRHSAPVRLYSIIEIMTLGLRPSADLVARLNLSTEFRSHNFG